jgi:hypothetical protein
MGQIVNLLDGLRGAMAMLCPDTNMQNDPFHQALGHLEAAIDRLETVARAPAPDARLAALEQRHTRLRDGAAEALARLDRLIGSAVPRADEG